MNNVCKVLLIIVRKAFEGHLTAVGIGWDDSSPLPGASKISVYTRFQNLKTWVSFLPKTPETVLSGSEPKPLCILTSVRSW